MQRLLQRLRPQRVPDFAHGAQVYLDFADVAQRLRPALQRLRTEGQAMTDEFVVLRAKMTRILQTVPVLARSAQAIEAR